MSLDQYPKPNREAPNKTKSAEKLEEEEQLRKDVDMWMRDNEVKKGSPLYTRSQYKGLDAEEKRAKSKYVRTVSYGSF